MAALEGPRPLILAGAAGARPAPLRRRSGIRPTLPVPCVALRGSSSSSLIRRGLPEGIADAQTVRLAAIAGSSTLAGLAALLARAVAKGNFFPQRALARWLESLRGVEVTPTPGSPVGAQVTGVDLGAAMSTDLAEQLRAALQEHGLLLFRKQALGTGAMLRAADVFGRPVPAQGLGSPVAIYRVKDRDPQPRGQDFWHSDNSYVGVPGGPTMLYALRVPRGSDGTALGDTLFADASAAAAELPAELREQVVGRSAIHNVMHNGGVPLPEYTSGEWEAKKDAVHPILRKNPLSGAETIFVSPAYVRSVVDLSPEASESLLEKLYEHMLQPAFLHRHSWEEGDFLVWDNGRVLHKATTLEIPKGMERLMYRVQTVNDLEGS